MRILELIGIGGVHLPGWHGGLIIWGLRGCYHFINERGIVSVVIMGSDSLGNCTNLDRDARRGGDVKMRIVSHPGHTHSTMLSFSFFFLFAAICHSSTDTNKSAYARDMLFSADQGIQTMSLPLYHRFESESVKRRAQAGSIVQAWQDILGPEAKVHFPGVFDEDKHLANQQLQSWNNGNIYEWY